MQLAVLKPLPRMIALIQASQMVLSCLMMSAVSQAKWNALRDAADAYSELSDFARREKQWLLQRVSPGNLFWTENQV